MVTVTEYCAVDVQSLSSLYHMHMLAHTWVRFRAPSGVRGWFVRAGAASRRGGETYILYIFYSTTHEKSCEVPTALSLKSGAHACLFGLATYPRCSLTASCLRAPPAPRAVRGRRVSAGALSRRRGLCPAGRAHSGSSQRESEPRVAQARRLAWELRRGAPRAVRKARATATRAVGTRAAGTAG